MLYSTRAGQHEQNPCCWRFFHETTRTDRPLRGAGARGRGLRRRRRPVGLRQLGRRGRRPADHEGPVGRADRADQAQLPRDQARLPEGRHGRPGEPEDERDPVPDPEQRVPAGGRQARRQGQRQGRRRAPRPDQEAVLRQPRGPEAGDAGADGEALPGRAQAAGLHRRGGPAGDQAPADPRGRLQEGHQGRQGLGRRDQDLLRQEQAAVRDAGAAGEPRRPPHPGQDEEAGRPALRAAAGRTRASSPRSPRSTRPTPRRRRTAASSRRARRSRAGWCRSSRRSPSRSRRT